METSTLTGISRGRFADLSIKRLGSFQDINAVLDGITSGGGVDLSDYPTNAQTDAAIAVETAARTAAIPAAVACGCATTGGPRNRNPCRPLPCRAARTAAAPVRGR